MNSFDIRKKFLEFFKLRGHAVIPSASLVPENDPSVLFTTAGMQPLVPYLLGETHPEGKRLVNIQKSMRTTDIDEIGDATHLTFFEMLGNWSLGDSASPDGIGEAGYFKKEAIEWSFEFLISQKEGLGLDPSRLYVTCFEGDKNAPKDEESADIWESVGIPKERIFFLGAEDNWWSPGDDGPCGPDTEMFYNVTNKKLDIKTKEDFKRADKMGHIVEVWNDVFMEYEKTKGKVVGKLKQKNVDTGAGLERLTALMQGVDNVYETDLFASLMREIEERSYEFNIKSSRIVADHLRAAVFLIADGVKPSNTDRGYVLRRLIRRAVRHTDIMSFTDTNLKSLVPTVTRKYSAFYKELGESEVEIMEVIGKEEEKFEKTLKRGLSKFQKVIDGGKEEISAKEAFDLYQSYGFPIELTEELADEKGIKVDTEGFNREMEKHQEISKKSTNSKFKGGLADTSEKSVRYHTATHLLNAALRQVLGNHVEQRGSNITDKRLRFDFSHPKKMSNEEIKEVEDLVNKKIKEEIEVTSKEVSLEKAKEEGALGVFGQKYGDKVRVYTIGNFSKEICGGPHVDNTEELGKFKIVKESSSSAGVRRIKAILE